MNNRQKKMGYNAAHELLSSLGVDASRAAGRGYQKGSGYLMKHAYTIIADLHTHTLFSGHAHSTVLGNGGRRPG